MPSVKKTVPVITIAAAATAAAFALGLTGSSPIAAGPDVYMHTAQLAAGPDVYLHTAPTFLADGSTPDVYAHT
jgi:tryptophan synthase alpha subunit